MFCLLNAMFSLFWQENETNSASCSSLGGDNVMSLMMTAVTISGTHDAPRSRNNALYYLYYLPTGQSSYTHT